VVSFTARYYSQDPNEVAKWRPDKIIKWYNEAVPVYERELELGICPWRCAK
jgi:hypothetical protein